MVKMTSLPASRLCLTFDNMGSAQAVGKGETACCGNADKGPDGYPQALALLDRLGIKATFFVEGWNALHNPRAVRQLAERGHDVAMHGWVHEVIHALDPTAVERVLHDSFAAFRNIGVLPSGFRAPGGKRGVHTLPILRQLELLYDSSIDHGPDDPADAVRPTPGVIDGDFPNIPWQWQDIDYYHYAMHPEGPRSPVQLRDHLTGKLDDLARDGGVATFIFHAFVSCQQADRAEALESVIRHAQGLGIEIVTASELARGIQTG